MRCGGQYCHGMGVGHVRQRICFAGTVCRAADPNKLCDVAEYCPGGSGACPADGFASPGTVCRAADTNNLCDVADTARWEWGMSGRGFASARKVCRAADPNKLCDVAEYCPGGSGACPADRFASPGTVCRAADTTNLCDVAEYCPGGSADCPIDKSVVCTRPTSAISCLGRAIAAHAPTPSVPKAPSATRQPLYR